MSLKRLHVDRKEVFLEGRTQGIAVRLVDPENPYHLRGSIRGPKDSPYFGGLFELDIHIPADYAFKPPKISFLTEVYHPFVSARGIIGLSVLKEDWSPAWTLYKVLLAIQALLGGGIYEKDDDMSRPLNEPALRRYKTDRAAFNQTALSYTHAFAHPNAVTHLCELVAVKDRDRAGKVLAESGWDDVDAVVALFTTKSGLETGDTPPCKKARVIKGEETNEESVGGTASQSSYVNVSSCASVVRRMNEATLDYEEETSSAQDSFIRVAGVVEGMELVGIGAEDDASLSTTQDSFVCVDVPIQVDGQEEKGELSAL